MLGIGDTIAKFNEVTQDFWVREAIFDSGAVAFLALERILPKVTGKVIQKYFPDHAKEKPEKSPEQLLLDAKKQLFFRIVVPLATMGPMTALGVLKPDDPVFHASVVYLGYGIAESIMKIRNLSVENQLAVEP